MQRRGDRGSHPAAGAEDSAASELFEKQQKKRVLFMGGAPCQSFCLVNADRKGFASKQGSVSVAVAELVKKLRCVDWSSETAEPEAWPGGRLRTHCRKGKRSDWKHMACAWGAPRQHSTCSASLHS
jgi:hypothetical protein